jgi:hypothetical protein
MMKKTLLLGGMLLSLFVVSETSLLFAESPELSLEKSGSRQSGNTLYTLDVTALNMHGQDIVYNWLAKDGAKKFSALCYTPDRTKAQYTLRLDKTPPITAEHTGVRTVVNTDNGTTN